MKTYKLTKTVWTHEDFEVMGWHDSKVWGMMTNTEAVELVIDLDYIFQWVHPEPGEEHYKFWVAPVTMVFESAHDMTLDLESHQGEIEIDDFHIEEITPPHETDLRQYRFHLACQQGEIGLNGTGFTMFVRQNPKLLPRQHLELSERGGVGFGRELADLRSDAVARDMDTQAGPA